MSLVIDGETEKMGILYERYRMPVYSYFYKVTCGDREASEDLVHTVFYRALRYRNTFSGNGSFAKWLFTIVRNAGLDHNRKKKKNSELLDEVTSENDPVYFENDLEKKEELVSLDSAMGMLNPEEREIIVLGKIECLKYKEIAEIIGTTEGSVKVRIFRAMRKLKDIFLKLENNRYEKEKS